MRDGFDIRTAPRADVDRELRNLLQSQRRAEEERGQERVIRDLKKRYGLEE